MHSRCLQTTAVGRSSPRKRQFIDNHEHALGSRKLIRVDAGMGMVQRDESLNAIPIHAETSDYTFNSQCALLCRLLLGHCYLQVKALPHDRAPFEEAAKVMCVAGPSLVARRKNLLQWGVANQRI